jgi:hypothetical protein
VRIGGNVINVHTDEAGALLRKCISRLADNHSRHAGDPPSLLRSFEGQATGVTVQYLARFGGPTRTAVTPQ